ncbi:TonB-dependent receptor [Pelagicoccus mobilis]|uniref:TonB-dependent receptor plug domain-containing protein n=1 Tax=Pelagicoccus mobilis TaxID=415221 RepID=A0A934RWI2_9BACT|nr:TonB-dependent receptor plug domain-containing protein [Pelagicoccus mobilis]MBK1877633.1 TonB-dependent receptor plug domain-containing protein [Pelagicoccus mobilis]
MSPIYPNSIFELQEQPVRTGGHFESHKDCDSNEMGIRDVIFIALASKLAIHPALEAAQNSNDPNGLLLAQSMRFEIGSAWAEESLPLLLAQIDLPVIYIRNEITGIKLNAVIGEYSPAEALHQLTANTGLVVIKDEDSGTWLIKRQDPESSTFTTMKDGSNNQQNSFEPNMANTKPTPKKRLVQTSKGLLALLAASNVADIKGQENEEEVFELSPFSVTGQEDSGYRATSTLAGTRLNTDLKNVGSAISVLTQEFFEDTGATDAASVLSYALSTEVSGPQGNFAGNTYNSRGNSANTNSVRANPEGAQRVRGLASAELTRNYFLTDIAFDSYNTSAVTINRGPNSLLFGIGSPGGVIENSLNKASLGSDFGEVSLRLGKRGSYRASVDYNKVLIEDKLAVRFAVLDEEENFRQEPAFEEDSRFFFTFESVLAKNEDSDFLGKTTLRGNYENGSIDRNPPEVLPPADGLKDWFSTPDPAIQDIVGIDWATTPGADWAVDGSFVPKWTVDSDRIEGFPGAFREPAIRGSAREPYFISEAVYFQPDGTIGIGIPSASDLTGVQARILYKDGEYGRVGGNPRTDLHYTKPFEGESYSPNFVVPVIMNRNIFDNRNHLLYGNSSFSNDDFEAYNLTLEQSFFGGNGGLEIAFDEQNFERESSLPFTGSREYAIRIDVSENLPYQDVPNPNLGRPVIATNWGDMDTRSVDRQALRATAFYQLDFTDREDPFKWIGKHVLTGFYSEQEIDRRGEGYIGRYVGADFDFQAAVTQRTINNFRNGANIIQYIGPSYLNDSSIQSKDDIHIGNIATIPAFVDGEEFKVAYFDSRTRTHEIGHIATRRILNSGSLSQDKIDSNVFSIQSYLLNGNLVGLAGWREDSIDSYEIASNDRLPTGEYDPANFVLGDTPASADGDTFTWSLVAHVPQELPGKSKLSFHYNESENFAPSGVRRNTLGDLLSPPEGTTKEYGFSLDLLESKLFIRANWYETTSANAQDSAVQSAANSTLSSPLFWLQNFKEAELDGLTIAEALTTDQNPPEAGSLFSSYDEHYNTIIGSLPPTLAQRANIRYDGNAWVTDPLPGRIATTSFKAEGFEVDLTATPTSNWRLGLNVAKQETVQSDTAAVLSQVSNTLVQGLQGAGLWDLNDAPLIGGWTFNTRYTRDAILPVAAALTKDGQFSPEQRKWRANAFTNYKFEDGRFKGLGIGGALRWQDKVATGFPLSLNSDGIQVPDLSSPFLGSDELSGDLWASYQTRLGDKIDWKIQLNIRNLIGESDYIPVRTNPDGSLAVVRNPNPTEVFLTNTFKF